MMTKHTPYRVAAAALTLALTACAAPQKPLYQWGAYPGSVYQYLKGGTADLAAQIATLEDLVQSNASAGRASPPGLHGHLALLYSKAGDDANTIRHLEAERKLFPESAVYIDHLLKKGTKS